MSERSAMVFRAAAMTHGKYCSALTSSVTATSSRNSTPSAREPRTPRRKSATLTNAPRSRSRGQPVEVGQVAGVGRTDPVEECRQLRRRRAPSG